MDSLWPGLGNHFASLGAWNRQLTKEPVAVDRPSNLRAAATTTSTMAVTESSMTRRGI
jgi:hypothetical protein